MTTPDKREGVQLRDVRGVEIPDDRMQRARRWYYEATERGDPMYAEETAGMMAMYATAEVLDVHERAIAERDEEIERLVALADSWYEKAAKRGRMCEAARKERDAARAEATEYRWLQENLPGEAHEWDGDESPATIIVAGIRSLLDDRNEARADFAKTTDAIHADIVALLTALDLGIHARPYSPHEVIHRDVLPAIQSMRADLAAAREEIERLEARLDAAHPEPPQEGKEGTDG